MFSESQEQILGPYCLWCYSIDKLSRCGRCSTAFYCCRDHQVQHWKIHRKNCVPSLKTNQNESNVLPSPIPISNNPTNIIETSTTHMSSTHIAQSQFVPNVCQQFDQDIQPQFSSNIQQKPSTYSWLPNTVENTNSTDIYSPEQLSSNAYESSNCFLSPEIAQAASTIYETHDGNLDNFYAANAAALDDKLFIDNNDLFSSLTSELLNTPNNYWDIINSCNTLDDFDLNCDLNVNNDKEHVNEKIVENTFNLSSTSITSPVEVETPQENHVPEKILLLDDVCQNVVHDLNEYGICVIDDFLGSKMGNAILTEVKCMFLKGLFKRGELVSSGLWHTNEIVRGDVITWANGTENGCHNIGYLIKKLDIVMAACNKMSDNGILSNYKLNRRTKAMIACYPADGTYYKKHIDNPNNDGRCITCIYYLNKNWDVKTQGGLLRMFPVGHESEVANIEPIFDRMLFFWSDKRNPHEVLPSFAVRFAITVWYFDADEREKALREKQNQQC